jgi:hypothetical protein
MGCDYVQGFYFSKPVPHEDFEHFIVERMETKTEVTPKVKKTYMSISRALTSNFESIYYVDVVTAFYLEFFMSGDGNLEIRPAGTDFFEDAARKLLEDVCDADAQKVSDAISKANLIRLAEQDDTLNLSFGRMMEGLAVSYTLQTIRTRESDHHHVVLGVGKE